jgi:hypothetical protein
MPGDRRHTPPRLRAFEMVEERALGGKLAGTLYLTGAVTATAMLAVPGVEKTHWRITADLCMRSAKAAGKDRSRSTRDFALDTAGVV